MAVFTQTLTIGDTAPDERIDSYLRQFFPSVSRKAIVRLIQDGHIVVNGEMVKPRYFPKAGEQIDVSWPEPREPVSKPENIPLNVIYEDDDLLVIDKEAGIVVHPGNGHEEHTLVNAFLHHCKGQLSGVGGVARPGIVHRLDKDTSGCMIVAKNDFAHVGLAKQFAERTMEKIYHALVCGDAIPASGESPETHGRPGRRTRPRRPHKLPFDPALQGRRTGRGSPSYRADPPDPGAFSVYWLPDRGGPRLRKTPQCSAEGIDQLRGWAADAPRALDQIHPSSE
jgi:23S rRNA-/tRNA-specific pseudouridylate synthase